MVMKVVVVVGVVVGRIMGRCVVAVVRAVMLGNTIVSVGVGWLKWMHVGFGAKFGKQESGTDSVMVLNRLVFVFAWFKVIVKTSLIVKRFSFLQVGLKTPGP